MYFAFAGLLCTHKSYTATNFKEYRHYHGKATQVSSALWPVSDCNSLWTKHRGLDCAQTDLARPPTVSGSKTVRELQVGLAGPSGAGKTVFSHKVQTFIPGESLTLSVTVHPVIMLEAMACFATSSSNLVMLEYSC